MQTKKGQKGFSLIELLIVVAIIGIIAAIAVPNLLASKRSANEGSAIGSVRSLSTAEAEYFTTVGANLNYGDLSELEAEGLIDTVLGGGTKSGYNFLIDNVVPGGGGAAAQYEVTADAVSYTAVTGTGTRGFYSDESAVIYGTVGAAGSRGAKGAPIQ